MKVRKNITQRKISLAGGFLLLSLGLLVSGCVSKPWDEGLRITTFKMEATANEAESLRVTLPVSGTEILVQGDLLIGEEDITGVDSIPGKDGQMLMFRLRGDASRKLYRLSGQNIGKRLVLFIDGNPVGAREIDRAIGGGSVAVYVEMSAEEFKKTVRELKDSTRRIQEHISKR